MSSRNGSDASSPLFDDILGQWSSFAKEFDVLETGHSTYSSSLEALYKQQTSEKKTIQSSFTKLAALKDAVRRFTASPATSDEEKGKMADLLTELADWKTQLGDMQQELPRDSNGVYLSIILGSTLDVSLMSKNDRFRYKDEYEKFKLTVTIVVLIAVTLTYLVATLRVTDAFTHFLLVWYYCTLTIRESILRVNGSKIKGWWVYHHFVSCALCGTMLTWPDTKCYRDFRSQFLGHCFYIACVQLLQVQYQRGCLRRLRALGHRHEMDITVDGFHTWMFKGLTFLLPFLVIGYAFQLYNALYLFQMFMTAECTEYQVLLLAILFFVIAVGNAWTTFGVIYKKYAVSGSGAYRRRLTTKYSVTISRTAKGATSAVDEEVLDAVIKESDRFTADKKSD